MIQQTQTVIKINQSYKLSLSVIQEQRKLILDLYTNKQSYQCMISNIEDNNNFQEYFQNLDNMINYMKQQGSTEINLSGEIKVLKILVKINTKRNKIIKILEFQFLKISDNKKKIKELIKRCCSQNPLKDKQIKYFIKLIASLVDNTTELLPTPQQLPQISQPVDGTYIGTGGEDGYIEKIGKIEEIKRQFQAKYRKMQQLSKDNMQQLCRYSKQNQKIRYQYEQKCNKLQIRIIKLQASHATNLQNLRQQYKNITKQATQYISTKILQLSSVFISSEFVEHLQSKITSISSNYNTINNKLSLFQQIISKFNKFYDKNYKQEQFCHKYSFQLSKIMDGQHQGCIQ